MRSCKVVKGDVTTGGLGSGVRVRLGILGYRIPGTEDLNPVGLDGSALPVLNMLGAGSDASSLTGEEVHENCEPDEDEVIVGSSVNVTASCYEGGDLLSSMPEK